MKARKELMCSKVNKWVTISAKRYKCLSKPVHRRKEKTKIKGRTHTKHLVIDYMSLEHLTQCFRRLHLTRLPCASP